MSNVIAQETMMSIVNGAMNLIADEQAIRELAASNDNEVSAVMRWQTLKAGTTGFISGLPGGMLAIPAALADVTATLYTQVRMVAAIAYIRGYRLDTENVRYMVLVCLLGEKAVGDLVKKAATEMLTVAVERYIESCSAKTFSEKLAEKLGTRLISQSAAGSLKHLVPLIGGVVNATYDAVVTKAVGELADKMFPARSGVYMAV